MLSEKLISFQERRQIETLRMANQLLAQGISIRRRLSVEKTIAFTFLDNLTSLSVISIDSILMLGYVRFSKMDIFLKVVTTIISNPQKLPEKSCIKINTPTCLWKKIKKKRTTETKKETWSLPQGTLLLFQWEGVKLVNWQLSQGLFNMWLIHMIIRRKLHGLS